MNHLLSLQDFAGRWRFGRRVEYGDRPGQVFEGVARLAPVAGEISALAYAEAGELRLPGMTGGTYLWRPVDGGIDLCFADGSDFHHISLAKRVATAWFDTPEARYEMSYNFTRWPQWRAIWRKKAPGSPGASGFPAGDATMITDYRR